MGIGAVGADVSAFDGSEAVVAVLDTGIDPAHQAFAGVDLAQKDFTGQGSGDNHGHGTHSAGTIFGRALGGQRIDFPGFVDQLVKQYGMPVAPATSYVLKDYRANVQLFEKLAALVCAQSLFGRAALIVAAAGNESERDTDPNFEIGVSRPAVAEGIISVAALDRARRGWSWRRSRTPAQTSGAGRQCRFGQSRRAGVDERHQHGHAALGLSRAPKS